MPTRIRECLCAPLRALAAVPPATRAVALSCVAVHAMQRVVALAPIRTVFLGAADGTGGVLFVPDVVSFLFAISGGALSLGFFWTPVTYLWLHAGWSHLALNLIGLLVFGSAVEREGGLAAFWTVYLGSGIIGGAGWALAQGLASPVPCVGASAAVLGLAGAFAALRPHARFALIFPFPAVLPAWALAAALFLLNALELAFVVSSTAYLAHLVGLAAGVAIGIPFRRRLRHA